MLIVCAFQQEGPRKSEGIGIEGNTTASGP
jgi:hypothetical protein